jgi:RNA polymerase sigma factor (TIGR02999 family)
LNATPIRAAMNIRDASPKPGIATDRAAAAPSSGPDRDALFSALYDELHRLARRELARRSGSGAFSPTTLLHEAYLDMAGRRELAFPDRARFMGYASRVMRGLIIDYARSRSAAKRGGQHDITSLKTDVAEQASMEDSSMVQLGEILDDLAGSEPALAELVDLKFFCGFSVAEIAALRGVSERTIQRDWEKARAYMHRGLQPALTV